MEGTSTVKHLVSCNGDAMPDSLELFRREVFESRRLLAEICLLKHAIFRAHFFRRPRCHRVLTDTHRYYPLQGVTCFYERDLRFRKATGFDKGPSWRASSGRYQLAGCEGSLPGGKAEEGRRMGLVLLHGPGHSKSNPF